MSRPYASFREFYPFYLSEHRNRACRKFHFAGTTIVIALAIAAIVDREPLWLLLVPLAGYGFAWIGHFVFEKNRPATFRHPLWSLMGDWVMYWELIVGKIGFEERDPGADEGADPA